MLQGNGSPEDRVQGRRNRWRHYWPCALNLSRGPERIPVISHERRTMFTELSPLLKDRTLMLTIASLGDETLRVNVIPQHKSNKENDVAEPALTSALTITGTAEEL